MVVVLALRLNEENPVKLLTSLERLCIKEENCWKERIFHQTKSDEVNCNQRNSICSWLRKTAASMHFGIETFALSVDLLDRFLATLKVRPKFLECLAVGCLYIAAKTKEEDEKISITPEFVIDCDAKCSSNELLRMERLILDKFDWFTDFVTPVDFLQIYYSIIILKLIDDKNEFDQRKLVDEYIHLEIQLSLCLQHHRLCSFKPRILALALISLEFERQQNSIHFDHWLSSIIYLQQLAKIESGELLLCRDLIVRLIPSYKVVRLELSDLKFHSNVFNSFQSLINSSDRPSYADVLRRTTFQ